MTFLFCPIWTHCIFVSVSMLHTTVLREVCGSQIVASLFLGLCLGVFGLGLWYPCHLVLLATSWPLAVALAAVQIAILLAVRWRHQGRSVKPRSVPDPVFTSGEHTKEQQEASAVAAFQDIQGAGLGQAESAPA